MKTYRMNSLGVVTEIKEQPQLTAYELADFIDNNDCEYINLDPVSNMLRMQADEITALREQLNESTQN